MIADMLFKLTIQYDGTNFHGWQSQGEERTVQGELRRALALIAGKDIAVHGAGRTDAGVHAEGQVASLSLEREIAPERLRAAINGNIGRDVRVIACEAASDDFHARYSAREKSYVYRIVNSAVMSPFWARYALHEGRALDLKGMRACAELFLGEHDWTAFSAAQSEVKSRVRTITRLDIEEHFDERARAPMIEICVSADGFLRYMVRSVVGTLLEVGRGEKLAETVARAIHAGERELAGQTAPACGLTLLKVSY